MRKEAEAHAEDDKKRKEEIEVVNQADALVYSSERLFEDMKGKVDDSKIDAVKKEVEELKKLLEEKNVSEIKKKTEHVNKKLQELSIELYEKVSKEQPAGNPSEEAPKDDTVVDAEYTEKDEEEKNSKKKKE